MRIVLSLLLIVNEIDGARLKTSPLIAEDNRRDDGRGLLNFFDQDNRRQDDGVDQDVADAITDCLNDLIGCILNPIAEDPGNPALLAAISATTFVGGIAGAAKIANDPLIFTKSLREEERKKKKEEESRI